MHPGLLQEKRVLGERRKEEFRNTILHGIRTDAAVLANERSFQSAENRRKIHQEPLCNQNSLSVNAEQVVVGANTTVSTTMTKQMHQESQITESQQQEDKLRETIRKNSTELKELEKKLSFAYLAKDWSHQVKEREMHDMRLRALDAAETKLLMQRLEEEELQAKKEANEKARQYRMALLEQIKDNEDRKLEQEKQVLKDKELMDYVMSKANARQALEDRIRETKQRENREYLQHFAKEQERLKQSEKQREREEMREIEEFERRKLAREEQFMQKKMQAKQEKDAIYKKATIF